jgi:hypothetical protein
MASYHVFGWPADDKRPEPVVFIGAHMGGVSADMVLNLEDAEKLKKELIAVLDELKVKKNDN